LQALFQLITSFDTTIHKEDDRIGINHFLSETYLQAAKFLENTENIPLAMIRTQTPLLSSYDIGILADAVLSELKEKGFYQ